MAKESLKYLLERTTLFGTLAAAIVVAAENAVKYRLDDKLRAELKNGCIERPKIPPQETGQ